MDRGAMLVSGGAAMVALGAAACLIAFPAAPAPDLGGPVVTTVADPDPAVAVIDVANPAAEPAPEPADAPAPGGAEVVTAALPTAADGTTAVLTDAGSRDAWAGDRAGTPDVGYRDSTRDGWNGDPGSRDGSGSGGRHDGDRDGGRTGW